MRNFIINVYLFLGAYQDQKTKSIKNWYLYIGYLLGSFCMMSDFFAGEMRWYEYLLKLVPGIFFLIISKLKGNSIGNGDGQMLIILGNCFELRKIWSCFYLSMMLLAAYSFVLLFCKKANRQTQIPYFPFLWFSDFLWWGLQYVT